MTSATVPPRVTTTQEAEATEKQLRLVLADDILSEYVAALEKKADVKVYPENVRRVTGGEY